MKTLTIPVAIGVIGVMKKGNEKYLEQIPGSPNLNEMQKQHLQALLISYEKPYLRKKNQTVNN